MGACADSIALYAAHKETYDALLAESRALREEEIRMSQAFSALPSELATSENFRLFMRDIHLAHDELQSRLDGLMDELVGQRLEASRRRWEGVRERLEPVLHDTCEEGMPPKPTLEFLCCANEYVNGDIERVEERLAQLGLKLSELKNAMIHALHHHSDLISNESAAISQTNNNGIAARNWLLNTTSVQFLHDANGQLNLLNQHQQKLKSVIGQLNTELSQFLLELTNDIQAMLRVPVEKYEPVRRRVDEGSPLAKLIAYLNDNC